MQLHCAPEKGKSSVFRAPLPPARQDLDSTGWGALCGSPTSGLRLNRWNLGRDPHPRCAARGWPGRREAHLPARPLPFPSSPSPTSGLLPARATRACHLTCKSLAPESRTSARTLTAQQPLHLPLQLRARLCRRLQTPGGNCGAGVRGARGQAQRSNEPRGGNLELREVPLLV